MNPEIQRSQEPFPCLSTKRKPYELFEISLISIALKINKMSKTHINKRNYK